MKVVCPSCKTRFQVDPAKLQPVGRHVRCAKCSHRWLQLPEGMELPAGLLPPEIDDSAPATETAPPESPPEPESPTPTTEQPASSASAPAEAEQAEAEPADAGSPASVTEDVQPAKAPETPAEMAESLAAIAEQVAAAGQGANTAGGAGASQPAGGGPAQRFGLRMTGPIIVPPKMKPARPARRSSGMGLLLIAGVVIGILVVAYIFRDSIARAIPGADAIYSLIGISTDSPADDLEISIDTHNVQPSGGTMFFSVTATVFNRSEYPVDVPPLMIVPADESGNPLEPIRFRLPEQVAEPGQNIKFQKSVDNWPAAAKSFELRFEDAP